MRSARRKSLSPSRREIRNRHFRFLQIKNSSTPKTPLREDSFETAGEVGGSSKFSSWLPTIVFFSKHQVQANQTLSAGYIEASACACNRGDRGRVTIPAPTLTYVTESCSSAIPRTTYGQTRIGCLFQSLRCVLPAHTGLGSPSAGPPLNPANANRAYLDNTKSHFPRIGVLSAQRTGDTVSNYRRLKYRSCSHEEEQMP